MKSLILLLVVPPSLFLPLLPEHFETPKYFFILGVLIFSTLKKTKSKLNFLDKILVLYVLYYFLSSLFSVKPLISFFGLPHHYTGSFIFIFFLVFYLVLNKKLLTTISTSWLLKWLVFSSFIPVLYGYLQVFSFDFIVWKEPTTFRIFSTFGQPNFFALYLGIVLFSLLILILEKNKYLYLPYLLVLFILFLQTISISATLSLILVFLIYVWYRRAYLNPTLYVFIVFLLSLSFVFFGKPLIQRWKVQVYAIENTQVVTNDTAKIRKILFISTLEQVLNSPKYILLGSGPETFVFSYKRAPDLKFTSESNLYFINPHNFFLEEFFETGFLGMFFYLILVYCLFRVVSKTPLAVIPLFILIFSFLNWPGPYAYFLLFYFSYFSLQKYLKYM